MPPRSSARKHVLDPMQPLRIDDSYGKNNQLVPTRRSKRTQPVNEDEEDERLFRQVHGEEEAANARQTHVSEALHSLGAIDPAEEMPIKNRLPEEGPLGRVRAPFDPNITPYTGDLWGVADQKGVRDLYKAGQLQNPNVTPYNSRLHPSEPSESLAAKYGIATGRTARIPLSPTLIDTSRSFNHESSLYSKANLHTPTPLRQIQNKPENNSPPQNIPAPQSNPPPQKASQIHNNPPPTPLSQSPVSSVPLANPGTTKPATQGSTTAGPTGSSPNAPPQGSEGPSWMPSKSIFQELSQRMGIRKQPVVFNEPSLHYGHTTRNQLTEENSQEIDALRRRMRRPEADQYSLQLAGPWQEPSLPTSAGVGNTTSSTAATSSSNRTASLHSSTRHAAADPPTPRGGSLPAPHDPAASPLPTPRAVTVPPPSRIHAPGPGSTSARPVEPRPAPSQPWTVTLLGWWNSLCGAIGNALDSVPSTFKLFVLFALLTGLVATILPGDGNVAGGKNIGDLGLHWGGWSNLKDSIGQFIPSIRLPSWNSGGDDEYRDIEKVMGKITTKTGTTETALPPMVHVKTDKYGKISITPEFYHALNDYLAADDMIVKLKNARSASPEISHQVWLAIKHRLQREDWALPQASKPAGKHGSESSSMSRRDIELIVDDQLTKSWQSWLRQNSEAVSKILGPSVAEQLASKQEKEIKDYLEKNTKSDDKGMLVTRGEFAKQLQKEVQSQSTEFNGQLRDLTGRIKEFEKELLKHNISTPNGMTKPEVMILVDAAVRKAVADAKLQAAARAGIKAHLADHLENQINFFAVGSGAIVDPTYTSNAWQIPRYPFKSKKWLERDGYKSQPPVIALMPWRDEGECFCAGPNFKGHGVGTSNVSVLISRAIIPENLVVEHILPGATLDPGAMPREIEVWASFEELNLRHTVSAWSQTQFPNTPEESVLHTGFVKVGHFTYEDRNTGDGTQVFRLSLDLNDMSAASSSFVVRALNNYGADHTCFYRLRMYGSVRERDME